MAKQENKTFTIAGTAVNPDGTTKVRFANDLVARIKILNKAGCTDIHLYELPEPMTKLQALSYLQEVKAIIDGDAGFAVATKLAEKTKLARKAEVSFAVNPQKSITASLENARQTETVS